MRTHFDGRMARPDRNMTITLLTTSRIITTDACTSTMGGGIFITAIITTLEPTSASCPQ